MKRNIANENFGAGNDGIENIGNKNIGNKNVGSYNIGDNNNCRRGGTGNNIGNYNSGRFNIGNYNIGNNNIGDFNIGHYSLGCFNTVKPIMRIFDKKIDVKYFDNISKLDLSKYFAEQISLTKGYRKYNLDWWEKISPDDKDNIKIKLPNFDEFKFLEIINQSIIPHQVARQGEYNKEKDSDIPAFENIGYCNTGNSNHGDENIGNNNIGDFNIGDGNIGNSNTSDGNIGNSNTACYNRGNYNTGEFNIGSYNTGKYNIGSYNIGDCNITNYSIGFFNTQPQKLMFFDEETNIGFEEWYASDAWKLLSTFQDIANFSRAWFKKLTPDEKKIIKSIPNYNESKFINLIKLFEEQSNY